MVRHEKLENYGIFLLTKRRFLHFHFHFLFSNYLTAKQQIAYYDIREHFFFSWI